MTLTRPNLLVIGAQKAGTTSLHKYLGEHPQVFMARRKELHFFVEGLNGRNGWDCGWEKGWDWYEEQFAAASGARIVGEASPSYSSPQYPYVAERIAQHLPEVRLVYLIRNPVDRARSEYVHHRALGSERRPIGRALLEEPAYLDKGRYAAHIDRYLEHFEPSQLLVVLSEDLMSDRRATMAAIWRHLGIDDPGATKTLDQEFHRSDDKALPSAPGRMARRVPGYRWIGSHSPANLVNAFRRISRTAPRQSEVLVPQSVRVELLERLRSDLDRLRTLVPAALPRWGL